MSPVSEGKPHDIDVDKLSTTAACPMMLIEERAPGLTETYRSQLRLVRLVAFN